jgi:Asp-tRNA(Asn)/Glu-tRNA(Gln) amidotransferase A subunit family amidase
METAATILKRCDVDVNEVSFPVEFNDSKALKRMFQAIINSDARSAFLREYRMDATKLDPEIRGLVENSSNYTSKERAHALDQYASMRPVFDKLAAQYSAIITPSAPDEAPLGLNDMGDAGLNFLWTVITPVFTSQRFLADFDQALHMPVINIPAFTGEHGMPVGLSLVAGRFFDQHLLKISKVLSEPLMAGGGCKVICGKQKTHRYVSRRSPSNSSDYLDKKVYLLDTSTSLERGKIY